MSSDTTTTPDAQPLLAQACAVNLTPTVPTGPSAVRPAVGKVFGPYELLAEVGRGGMGVVYQARQSKLGRIVALKTLRHVDFASAEEVERFTREAQAVSRLAHPHVVSLLDFGQVDGCPYYTMPLLQGGNLEQHQARLFGDVRAAAALVEKLARGLHHAHEHGVIHRDLKPRNVLLDDQGEPLAADFGVAKLVDATELTAPGQVLGRRRTWRPRWRAGRRRWPTPAATSGRSASSSLSCSPAAAPSTPPRCRS